MSGEAERSRVAESTRAQGAEAPAAASRAMRGRSRAKAQHKLHQVIDATKVCLLTLSLSIVSAKCHGSLVSSTLQDRSFSC